VPWSIILDLASDRTHPNHLVFAIKFAIYGEPVPPVPITVPCILSEPIRFSL